ncbi:metallophosphoesterase domain-containing protein [Aspergillus fijiensis CBS 313.89]|uniref:Metallophosphoesterase domain-containing protein n=1 Tax=Aspergillus fijiensis CBS 313.89 TaxID=1448319 RepID=A0A8G1RUV2_9EURO|nr:metallophosphoesterase domain-containing protein [Aspergillus fijiensis CBS 313.89]RAK80527.1 metallophosphoesterase domain-containing protein [Aspergillus fijiensis CBS 313.89]
METSIPSDIKTRFLILSDTHGHELPGECSQHHADVVIHCGDLTDSSYLTEFRTTIQHLQKLDAPLKLVIPGNHDFTLDTPTFQQKVKASGLDHSEDDRRLVRQVYGDYEEVRIKLFTDDLQQRSGIVLLDEGIHVFILANGARLTVYASPGTPSLGGDWGFQYHPDTGHDFQFDGRSNQIDVVVTHGPPRGIMDYTSRDTHSRGRRAGCPDLFKAIARARPRMHCFGHIHEGWGAMLAHWRETRNSPRDQDPDGLGTQNEPSHFTAIDYGRSTVISKLAQLVEPGKQEEAAAPAVMATSHCSEDPAPLRPRDQTLFVNAAVQGCSAEVPVHPLWRVDLELPRAVPHG